MTKKSKYVLSEQDSKKGFKDSIIKNEEGDLFLMNKIPKNNEFVYLISKNNLKAKIEKNKIFQNVVDGVWKTANEHEAKAFKKTYDENMLKITQKVLKHVIVAELMVEVDEDLDFEKIGDKYFRSLVQKSINQAGRIADKYFDNLYEVDSETLQNMLRILDEFATKLSKLPLEDIPFFATYADEFFKNPKAFRELKAEFIKEEK